MTTLQGMTYLGLGLALIIVLILIFVYVIPAILWLGMWALAKYYAYRDYKKGKNQVSTTAPTQTTNVTTTKEKEAAKENDFFGCGGSRWCEIECRAICQKQRNSQRK